MFPKLRVSCLQRLLKEKQISVHRNHVSNRKVFEGNISTQTYVSLCAALRLSDDVQSAQSLGGKDISVRSCSVSGFYIILR